MRATEDSASSARQLSKSAVLHGAPTASARRKKEEVQVKTTISQLFEALGAPLANNRWSWGAVRPSDGAVFLRVWQDRKFVEEGAAFYELTQHRKYADNPDDLGHQERLRHVELIRSGARCYLVMCVVQEAGVLPRTIRSFNANDVFQGGELRERDGETWIRSVARIPLTKVAASSPR
jgi:hypothetical protein